MKLSIKHKIMYHEEASLLQEEWYRQIFKSSVNGLAGCKFLYKVRLTDLMIKRTIAKQKFDKTGIWEFEE